MRLLLLAACAVAVLSLSGCTGSSLGAALTGGPVCQPTVLTKQANGATLVPPALDDGSNPVLRAPVRAGQMLVATAQWATALGLVDVAFDGPQGDVQTGQMGERVWTSTTLSVPADQEVALGLHGAPFASGVSYVLTLTITGC